MSIPLALRMRREKSDCKAARCPAIFSHLVYEYPVPEMTTKISHF